MSAREAYLRACTYYRTSYMPLFGTPADEPLWDTPVEPVEIPFENGPTLPGVLALRDDSRRPRATIVHVNSYDSNSHEMFVEHVSAALRRGYNVLLFDGPGQGRALIRDGVPMRPDWENVVRPVLDFALARPEVDERRVVPAGRVLAPRAAAFEQRVAALWADPGQWDHRDRLPLADDEKISFPDGVSKDRFADLDAYLRSENADPMLRWRLLQRGLWVHGVASLFEYLVDLARYELSPVASQITCPDADHRRRGRPNRRRRPLCSTTRSPHDTRPCCSSRRPRARAATARAKDGGAFTSAAMTGSTTCSHRQPSVEG